MRSLFILSFSVCFPLIAFSEDPVVSSEKGYKVIKVNHEWIDSEGHTHAEIADFPAKAKYQKTLDDTGKHSGIRFHIHWTTPSARLPHFAVKLEVQGYDAKTQRETLETLLATYPKNPRFKSGWSRLDIKRDTLERLGDLMAWKVTLFQNGQFVAERKSFTWDESTSQETKTTQ